MRPDEAASLAHGERADAAFDWCVRNALALEKAADAERAAGWAMAAGLLAVRFGYSSLCSATLESLLLRLGGGLGACLEPAAKRGTGRARWLHVFTRTWEIGGHTALATRWIERNPRSEQHSLVLTDQPEGHVEPRIRQAVEHSGGRVVSLIGTKSLIGRAAALRAFASQHADVVVLHANPPDVIPALAFAAGGGPPVLLLNHADHAFWIGVAVADRVIDIRDSGQRLTLAHRGSARSKLLPLPLPDAGVAPKDRAAAAARLGNPSLLQCGLVLLTIGSAHKYVPVPKLDFFAAARRILQQVPGATLIAVGPKPEQASWQRLSADCGGRVIAVGPDPELRAWHAAADLYLEGFPVGSYTALLEVALAGRAVVRKPWLVPPSVLAVDRGALADIEPQATTEGYVARAVELCRDAAQREQLALSASAAVRAVHCGPAWDARLEALCAEIPAAHEPLRDIVAAPLPPELQHYWNAVCASRSPADPLDVAHETAQRMDLRPVEGAPVMTRVRDNRQSPP